MTQVQISKKYTLTAEVSLLSRERRIAPTTNHQVFNACGIVYLSVQRVHVEKSAGETNHWLSVSQLESFSHHERTPQDTNHQPPSGLAHAAVDVSS
jgi:hypothetical protein